MKNALKIGALLGLCVCSLFSQTLSGKKVLFVIAPKDFRDEELFEPQKYLQKLGATVKIASSKIDTIAGMLGGKAYSELIVETVKSKDFDAIIYVGGIGAQTLWDNVGAQKLAKSAYKEGKIVGAICLAPVIIARAGILKTCSATCTPSAKSELEKTGAKYTGKDIEICGKIITADGPASSKKFGEAIAKMLK
jgi:protease I